MELPDYRDNLSLVLDFFGGKNLLNIADLRAFTGLKDARTIRKRYPLNKAGEISSATFARALCAPPKGGNRR